METNRSTHQDHTGSGRIIDTMVMIGETDLRFAELKAILFDGFGVTIDSKVEAIVQESFDFLTNFSKDKIIYGINTGFGPMAPYRIEPEEEKALQENLIRSHSSGLGDYLDPVCTKASMVARLNTLCIGKSGVHPSAIKVLVDMINMDVTPVIFAHGGVGASGDLVQLAHLALVMLGEGEVFYKGVKRPTSEVFKSLGIAPMQIKLREGLALMNGTSVMTGIGIVNTVYAERAIQWSTLATIMIAELIDAYDDYFSPQLNGAKKHKGQQSIAKAIYQNLSESSYIKKREKQLYAGITDQKVLDEKVQEYYSIRCVPQISGIILETVEQCKKVLVEEINSANDNPIIDVESQNVYHGGNFHGDYVAFEMDKLKIAITKLTMLAERQINFLMNPKLNGILPPFVNLGKLGFNFGMQGVQFTATSTTAENQTLSNPMYVHSIPNNNDNQDIVSMGTNAANMASKVIDNAFEVLAIEIVSIVQAIDYLNKSEGLSTVSKQTFDKVRAIIGRFESDSALYKELKEVKEFMKNEGPLTI